MRHTGKFLSLAVVSLFFVAFVAFAQQSSLKVDIDLVLVNASVTNSRNEVITDLKPEHFQIFEDKIEQEIRYFSAETAPISLGIIFDTSHSMEKKIDVAREAAITCLERTTLDDEYFLVEFNNRARLTHDFTTDILRLQNQMTFIPPDGSTAMYDALYLGLEQVKNGQNSRKALLLITDGEDNHSRYSRGDIREFLRESDVQIYSIDLGRALIADLSELTGGHSYRASVNELQDVCENIFSELKNQYVLGYTPSNTQPDGKWRKIRVNLNPPAGMGRLTIRTKEGYYAPVQ